MNATASPQKTSMMECCLVKTVDAQMSAAQPKASTFVVLAFVMLQNIL